MLFGNDFELFQFSFDTSLKENLKSLEKYSISSTKMIFHHESSFNESSSFPFSATFFDVWNARTQLNFSVCWLEEIKLNENETNENLIKNLLPWGVFVSILYFLIKNNIIKFLYQIWATSFMLSNKLKTKFKRNSSSSTRFISWNDRIIFIFVKNKIKSKLKRVKKNGERGREIPIFACPMLVFLVCFSCYDFPSKLNSSIILLENL